MMMHTAYILTIGDELLRGELLDSNSAWLAQRLHQLGVVVGRMASVGGGAQEICAAVRDASRDAGVLVLSGGLGPTDDDRTAAAVAMACGRELQLHQDVLDQIKRRFEAAGMAFTDNNTSQALLPRGARVLPNARGTAPGFCVALGRCWIFALPGVPHELRGMFDAAVVPELERVCRLSPAALRRVKTFGLPEAQVDDLLADLPLPADEGCQASVHYRATFPEIHVSLLVRCTEPARAEWQADQLLQAARSRLDPHVFATGDESFAEAQVAALQRAGATLSIAESCTGGLAGELITQAAGSSAVFSMSVVAYSNHAKQQLLGLSPLLLQQYGAVSRECVEAMASEVRALAGSTYGVSISGVAGPSGGTADKPVGTVHFALAGPSGVLHLERRFPYDRARIRLVAAYVGHWLVRRQLERDAQGLGTAPPSDSPLADRWRVPRGS